MITNDQDTTFQKAAVPTDRPIGVIVAGHLCLDINPAFAVDGGQSIKDILIPGKLVNMGQAALSTGGAVSNTGISLHLLGVKTRLMGKIGVDLFGGVIEKILESYQAADGLIKDERASTSYSVVIAPPGVDRIFLHHPGANDSFCTADLDLDLLRSARLFHFGYPPLMRRMFIDHGNELVKLFQVAKSCGVTTSLDLALPDPASAAGQANWPEILDRILPLSDLFVPSLEELLFMTERPLFDRIKATAGDGDFMDYFDFDRLPALAGRILAKGVKIVIIKLGRRGYYVRTASRHVLSEMGPAAPSDLANWSNRELWSGVFHVARIASTSGAGDASIAGFLTGLLAGLPIEQSCQLACATAALKIQVHTSVGGILPMQETLERMAGWEIEPLDLNRHYWREDPVLKIWRGKHDQANV